MAKGWKPLPLLLTAALLAGCAAPVTKSPQPTAAPAPSPAEPTAAPAVESPAEEPPSPNIDEEAYARYRETVDDYFDRDVEETNRRREEYAPEWATVAGWELSDFYLAGEKEELGLQAYRMESLWYTDPPEKIFEMMAGGAWVDSRLRLHGNHWKLTYLAVLDGEPAGIFHLSGELDMDEFDTRQEFLDMMAENTQVGG